MKLTAEALSEALELAGLPEAGRESHSPGFLVYSSGHDFIACWVYSETTKEWAKRTKEILVALKAYGAEKHGEFCVVVRAKKD
jgi:hypothetical protein